MVALGVEIAIAGIAHHPDSEVAIVTLDAVITDATEATAGTIALTAGVGALRTTCSQEVKRE